jgi:hypothetical protein
MARTPLHFKIFFGLIFFCYALAGQQFPLCVTTAGNSNLRSEGLTELATNLTLNCTNAKPGVQATAMVIIETPVNITNHLSTNNIPDVVVSVTAGGFQQPVPANIQLVNNKGGSGSDSIASSLCNSGVATNCSTPSNPNV